MGAEHFDISGIKPVRLEDYVTNNDNLVVDYVGFDGSMQFDQTAGIFTNMSQVEVNFRYSILLTSQPQKNTYDNLKWPSVAPHQFNLDGQQHRFRMPLQEGYLNYCSASFLQIIPGGFSLGVAFIAVRIFIERQNRIYRILLEDILPTDVDLLPPVVGETPPAITYPPQAKVNGFEKAYPLFLQIINVPIGGNAGIGFFPNVTLEIRSIHLELNTDATIINRRPNLRLGWMYDEWALLQFCPFVVGAGLNNQEFDYSPFYPNHQRNFIHIDPLTGTVVRYVHISPTGGKDYDWRLWGMTNEIQTYVDNLQPGDQIVDFTVLSYAKPIGFGR